MPRRAWLAYEVLDDARFVCGFAYEEGGTVTVKLPDGRRASAPLPPEYEAPASVVIARQLLRELGPGDALQRPKKRRPGRHRKTVKKGPPQ